MSTTAPSLLILGTDTILAAAPATAVQLTHACMAAGFEAVVPASWGDELVAARVLERIGRSDGPAIQCSCPRVLDRLGPHGDAIEPMLVCTISPAAAAAEYLRALYAPARPTITFAGGCGGGASDAVDQWLSPADLLGILADRNISLRAQPAEFDTLPPDRRRYHSEPGGLPCRNALRQLDPSLRAVEVAGSDFITVIGQHLLSQERLLLDVAPLLGCACAGALEGVLPEAARARVKEHEPPRAPSPVVDHGVPVVLDAELPRARPATSAAAAPKPARVSTATATPEPLEAVGPQSLPPEPPRRRSPVGVPRPVFGASPRSSRPDGRALPRAYVARRRSSPRGVKTIPAEPLAGHPLARDRWMWAIGGLVAGLVLALLAFLLR